MSIKGSSYTWFRNAIEADQALVAWTSALELGRLHRLDDSVALVLCISRDDPRRYDVACARLLVRLQEAVALPFSQRERIREALEALRGDERARAAALDDLKRAFGDCQLPACAEAVAAYRERQASRPADD